MLLWRGVDCPHSLLLRFNGSMLSKFCKRLMRPGRLHRGIAIFFLAFTFADLVIADTLAPELCTEGAVVLPIVVEQAMGSEAYPWADAVRTTTPDSKPCGEQSERPEGLDEDCFCCCSHIIPGVHFETVELTDGSRLGSPANVFIPSSPPRGTYRPPRLF
jgi:hypothetical protein